MESADSLSKKIERRIKATRKRRLLEFIKGFKDRGESQAEAARKLGVEPGHLSQYTMKKKPRGLGEALARAMEQRANLPPYWFDELVIDQHLTPREHRLLENFRRVPEQARTGIEAILEAHPQDPDQKRGPSAPDRKAS